MRNPTPNPVDRIPNWCTGGGLVHAGQARGVGLFYQKNAKA